MTLKFGLHSSIVNPMLCVAVLLFLNLGCGLVKNPFRDYSQKPFNSAEWLSGDAVERGRMYGDVFKSRMLDGKSTDDVKKLLGEPEKKQTIENREVWLYRVEHQYNTPMKYFPVSFDAKRGAFAGRVQGGTISLVVEE
jgi:hypothetical protein